MLSKETLQTALENIETHWEAKNTQMGATEKARYKRSIAELKNEVDAVTFSGFMNVPVSSWDEVEHGA